MSDNPTAPENGNDLPPPPEIIDPMPPPEGEDLSKYDTQADFIIGAGVVAAAGIGWLPAFIDTAWLVASNSGMVSALALNYKYKFTGDNLRGFIFRLLEDSGITFASVRVLGTVIKMTGIGFLPGVAINGTMNAALTFAIGKAAQHYFKKHGNVPDDELIESFKKTLRGFGIQV
jgi:uncharacterized protein (DUF697 family)